ncbi:MAG: hypothetical protein AAGF60_03020 [Pseudomonadota bacterium]
MAEPRVALVPYGTPVDRNLGALPLAQVDWPLGGAAPDGMLADLRADDHVLIYPKTSMYLSPPRLAARLSVMVVEPRIIHARHLALLRLVWRRFHRVFTHDPVTLRRLPNARFLAAASTWVPDYAERDLTKSRGVSLIASAKRDLDGHRLRHEIAETAPSLDLMGRAYKPFDHKGDALAPYRFSVVIENIRAPGYFSEKLIDALLCETVPIYWGAPDIERYFDPHGMMVCTSAAELRQAIARADAGRYDAMRPALLRAKAQAQAQRDYRLSAARMLAAGE